MKNLSLLLLLAGSWHCYSQSKNNLPTREFSVITENDVFFFKDYYYSAGQDLVYKKLLSPASSLYKALSNNDTTKIILTYKAGLKIYTPREISQTEISKMDRPYAAYEYLSIGITRFTKINRGYSFAIDVGLVGKATGLGQFQAWWHKVLQLRTPRGWGYQINNEITVNVNYQRWQALRLTKKIDLVSTSNVYAGTASNRLTQNFTFRFFNFKSLKNSNFTHCFLSSQAIVKNEFFLFAGLGADYNASNIFIEGSLFKNNVSPYTLDALPFIFRQQLGLMYTTPTFFYSSTMHHLSREVADGIDHFYASFDIGFRF